MAARPRTQMLPAAASPRATETSSSGEAKVAMAAGLAGKAAGAAREGRMAALAAATAVLLLMGVLGTASLWYLPSDLVAGPRRIWDGGVSIATKAIAAAAVGNEEECDLDSSICCAEVVTGTLERAVTWKHTHIWLHLNRWKIGPTLPLNDVLGNNLSLKLPGLDILNVTLMTAQRKRRLVVPKTFRTCPVLQTGLQPLVPRMSGMSFSTPS
ncbi:hypothetical protein HU200_028955 [Digitaria exilis]|uniref:Uncharacterized protein n=1 Tax=Digitaria exilis TaxID=1010633 RepID=A0A835EVD9_9POAL|nr:hypothetical protein HU200_028955 [Digitaria exilis]